TVRGYFAHTVTDDPYQRVGEQDLTAHVDFTRLQRAGEAAGLTAVGLTTQADFLAGLGLGDLLVSLQTEPDVSIADYYAAQASVFRLIDPGGLGRFRVLAMAKDAPASGLPGIATSMSALDQVANESTSQASAQTSVLDPQASGAASLLFLCGADMDPTVARGRFPTARFIDIAHCAGPLPGLAALDDLGDGGVWGILVRVVDVNADTAMPGDDAVELAVTLPDGEQALARLVTLPADVADAAAVAAAVRYWELPPTYRTRVIKRAE
ncbi:MAG: SAM-dependent methyltransferase, partial [Chloroflexota bacterium]|nr:SAM-dependent methyltransferase [Chloroflexota bacterium]